MRTKAITIKRLAEIIMNRPIDTPIDFTTEVTEDSIVDENAFWNGIVKKDIFDTDVICIGQYGGSFYRSFSLNDIDDPSELVALVYKILAELDHCEAEEPDYDKIVAVDLETISPDEADVPLYTGSCEEARQNEEIEAYRDSIKANNDCAVAIARIVESSYIGDYLYDLDNAVGTILSLFSKERVLFVTAAEVSRHEWDARYSSAVKKWAAEVMTSYPNLSNANVGHIRCHATLVNSVAEKVMQL